MRHIRRRDQISGHLTRLIQPQSLLEWDQRILLPMHYEDGA